MEIGSHGAAKLRAGSKLNTPGIQMVLKSPGCEALILMNLGERRPSPYPLARGPLQVRRVSSNRDHRC